jgi:hypothetical protein
LTLRSFCGILQKYGVGGSSLLRGTAFCHDRAHSYGA